VAAARAGHEVVSCPDTSVYLDYRQSDHPDEPVPVGTRLGLAEVYAFRPVPDGLTGAEAARIIGAQCNVWTEHLSGARAIDYAMFPRLCAFAEVAWGTAEPELAPFTARLAGHLARLDEMAVEYRPQSGPRPWHARPDAPGSPVEPGERLAHLEAATVRLPGVSP
jgi:hexosaminidase